MFNKHLDPRIQLKETHSHQGPILLKRISISIMFSKLDASIDLPLSITFVGVFEYEGSGLKKTFSV